MKLNNLKPAVGSTHTSKRLGRGQGSGKGGTSTRGTKGAQARAGYEHKIGFEGGPSAALRSSAWPRSRLRDMLPGTTS